MKKKQRPVDDSIKHDIASVVDQLPQLLYNARSQETSSQQTPPPSKIHAYREKQGRERRTKKQVLITGVICITVIIISMWVWNMRVFWYQTQELTKDQPKLWDETREDLSSILDTAAQQKESIDDILKKIGEADQQKGQDALADAMRSLLSTTTSPAGAATPITSTVSTAPATTTAATNSTTPNQR